MDFFIHNTRYQIQNTISQSYAGYDSGILSLNTVLVLFSVTDNILAVAQIFLRPRLAISSADEISLRLTKTIAYAKQFA